MSSDSRSSTRRLALATCEKLPGTTEGDRLFVEALPPEWQVDAVPWSDARADWSSYDAVVLRSTWDYHLRADEFAQWLQRLARREVPTFNDPGLVLWNADKVYLRDLEARGHAIAPTHWVGCGSDVRLASVADPGWRDFVVKPSISASAHETWHVQGRPRPADERRFSELLRTHTVLVQPFLPEIVELGEWSILFAGGRYSHAVIKRPAEGDFRVQKEFGGRTTAADPPPALLEAARRLVADLSPTPLYARVDGIEREGEFLLLELELIEPDLFLEYSATAPTLLASAFTEAAESE